VIARDSLQVIHLSDLSTDDARRWLGTEWKAKRPELRKKNNEFLKYLDWLWRVCVKDVLDHVSSLYKGQDEALPRVWWIGCGLASSMPFHAAGIHAHASQENTFSRVVSSYTPSVRALGYARNQLKRAQNEQPRHDLMLIAAMPMTPTGANDHVAFKNLGGVLKESDAVDRIVSPHVRTAVCPGPSADYILSQLENCQIAHFACHGVSDPKDPSNSGLVLQRVATDGSLEQDHLSIHRLSHLWLRHALIAYLSACSTAENKGGRLQDEVIHVVSGFQVAGFPHVVGALWPAGDEECVQVASHFYKSLFEHSGVPELGARRVACALREAVMAVRDEDMDMPLNWAQFVHYGA
jgi:CHAT domain-containing protein